MIVTKRNLNGNTTSNGWWEEKPVSALLRGCVDEGLTAAGVVVNATRSS